MNSSGRYSNVAIALHWLLAALILGCAAKKAARLNMSSRERFCTNGSICGFLRRPSSNDATALMWAAAYGHVETVKLLLARGADAGATDNRGKTALNVATEEQQAAVAELLRAW